MHRAWLLIAAAGFVQAQARLTFEVASIKPSQPGARRRYQGSAGPGWIDDVFWDIDAKAAHSYSLDDLHTMFQNLLVDEFKMKFHKDIKEGPVYALMVDKADRK